LSSSTASAAAGQCSASSTSVTNQSQGRTKHKLAFQPGGISSGEDEEEHHYIANQTAGGMQYRICALLINYFLTTFLFGSQLQRLRRSNDHQYLQSTETGRSQLTQL